MMVLSQIALLLSLGGVVWQDFKDRWISVGLFVLIGVLSLVILSANISTVTGSDMIGSLSFIGLCFSWLALYSKIRYGSFLGFVDTAFGKGDILFILLLAFLLPFHSFILFFIGSTVLVLFASIIYQLINKSKEVMIPLAGGQALLLIVHFVLRWWVDIDLLSLTTFL